MSWASSISFDVLFTSAIATSAARPEFPDRPADSNQSVEFNTVEDGGVRANPHASVRTDRRPVGLFFRIVRRHTKSSPEISRKFPASHRRRGLRRHFACATPFQSCPAAIMSSTPRLFLADLFFAFPPTPYVVRRNDSRCSRSSSVSPTPQWA